MRRLGVLPAYANLRTARRTARAATYTEQRGDGGEYSVCLFEDNRQCEEWAVARGQCPVGGVKVSGYNTSAARYCAITGGQYTPTGNEGAPDEQAPAPSMSAQCDVWAYYNGQCP